MAEPTHYEVLGVAPDADRETIRRAYIALARATHPDRAGDEGARRARADEQIRRANEAWSVLGSSESRSAYDRSLAAPLGATSPSPAPSDEVRIAPSGHLVPARTAPLWKWGPVVVLLAILAAVVIGSAYATSHDSVTPTPTTSSARPVVGDCVDIGFSPSGPTALTVSCASGPTGRVVAIVDTPRPCPAASTTVGLADGRTTLCLVAV